MSYCRWSNSDLYVYDDVGSGLVCTCCPFEPLQRCENTIGGENFVFDMHKTWSAGDDAAAMVAHLEKHVAAGHTVGDALARLQAEIAAGDWTPEARAKSNAELRKLLEQRRK